MKDETIKHAEYLVDEFLLVHYDINANIAKQCAIKYVQLQSNYNLSREIAKNQNEFTEAIRTCVGKVNPAEDNDWETIANTYLKTCQEEGSRNHFSARGLLDYLIENYYTPDKKTKK